VRQLLSRRAFAVGAASLGLLDAAQASQSALSFLVIGDWGDPNTQEQRLVAAAMARIAEANASDFVISTGDNFYERGIRSATDPQLQSTFEDVYAAPALQTPWFVVLGNHDYAGEPDAEIAYSSLNPRWRMPARYWREDMLTPDGARAAFFFLDTTPLSRLDPVRSRIPGATGDAHPQLRWLERQLAICDSEWKIAVGHHPIFSGGSHGPSRQVDLHLRPLFETFGVNAYFNGHDHDLEHLVARGVNYICSGSGAEARPVRTTPESLFSYAHTGFASAALTRERLLLQFHAHDGATIYSAEIAR
jgi:acid phosphatase